MGLFDFFNSEYKAYKQVYDYFNYLPSKDKQFHEVIQSLTSFASGCLMMPMMIDKNLLKNPEKMNVMIAYFGGAADFLSQQLEFDEEKAYNFIFFFLVLMLCDGNYKRMGEVGNLFLKLPQQEKYYNIMLQGGNDYKELLAGNGNDALFLRLKKLL